MDIIYKNRIINKAHVFIRKLLKCPNCKGTKIVKSVGGMENRCSQCGKFETYVSQYFKKPVERYITQPFITYLVPLSTLTFFLMTYLAFYDPIPAKIAAAVSFFGLIFVALKFKLDQANYHKDLFQKRYEIFLVINDVLAAWCEEAKSTNEMINKISGDLMRRSYFLFGKHTYEFVCEFRRALIWTATSRNETDDIKFREEIKLARDFLVSIVDGQKLADKFPELKINYY